MLLGLLQHLIPSDMPKSGMSPGWRLFGELQMWEILHIFCKSSANVLQVPRSNVLFFRQTSSMFAKRSPKVLKMFKIFATIRRP